MQRYRDFIDLGASVAQAFGGGADFCVHLSVRVGEMEAFPYRGNAKARSTFANTLRIWLRPGTLLTRIDAIVASDNFEQQSIVGDVGSDGAGVIDGKFNGRMPVYGTRP